MENEKTTQPVAQPSTCGLTECQGRERCRPCIAMGMNAAPPKLKD